LKILILGYSSIFKKRILNVLIKNNIKFCVASKSSAKKEKKAFNWYRDYNYALNYSNADLVYISLPNSFHYYWAKKALNKNYHVIVDKPISENFSQAKNLVKIAKRKKKLIVEATFYNYHKQFDKALKSLNGLKNIKLINTNFIIPMPKKNSLRMSKELSGGCLMDMSPYAAATARLLGSGKLLKMYTSLNKNEQGLITSFNVFCVFQKNYYFGFFCFGGEYKNNMILFSKKKNIELNNVFSPPYNKNLKILIKQNNYLYINKIKKCDIFETFFKQIRYSYNRKKFNFYYKIILQDAKFREKLIK
jgi:NDP-hexose-3-ketoreductase